MLSIELMVFQLFIKECNLARWYMDGIRIIHDSVLINLDSCSGIPDHYPSPAETNKIRSCQV